MSPAPASMLPWGTWYLISHSTGFWPRARSPESFATPLSMGHAGARETARHIRHDRYRSSNPAPLHQLCFLLFLAFSAGALDDVLGGHPQDLVGNLIRLPLERMIGCAHGRLALQAGREPLRGLVSQTPLQPAHGRQRGRRGTAMDRGRDGGLDFAIVPHSMTRHRGFTLTRRCFRHTVRRMRLIDPPVGPLGLQQRAGVLDPILPDTPPRLKMSPV